MVTTDLIQRLEEFEFDLFILGGRLNYEIGRGHLLQMDTGRDASEDLRLFIACKPAFFNKPLQIIIYPLLPLLNKLRFNIIQNNLKATGRGNLGDTAAHLPGPDDAECFYFHNTINSV